MFVIVVVTTIDKTSRTQPAAQRIRFNISKTQLNSTRGEADARETMMIIITISRANLIFKMRMIRSDGGCRSTAGVELCHYNRYFLQWLPFYQNRAYTRQKCAQAPPLCQQDERDAYMLADTGATRTAGIMSNFSLDVQPIVGVIVVFGFMFSFV